MKTMRWIKTCVRKEPHTYTIVKVPDVIDAEFIDWVNNQIGEGSKLDVVEVIMDNDQCKIISTVDYDEWYQDLNPNQYIVINNYTGSYRLFSDKKEVWDVFKEIDTSNGEQENESYLFNSF